MLSRLSRTWSRERGEGRWEIVRDGATPRGGLCWEGVRRMSTGRWCEIQGRSRTFRRKKVIADVVNFLS